jgi:hypothetical protein
MAPSEISRAIRAGSHNGVQESGETGFERFTAESIAARWNGRQWRFRFPHGEKQNALAEARAFGNLKKIRANQRLVALRVTAALSATAAAAAAG